MAPTRTRAAGILLATLAAAVLAGCAGPLPDDTEAPEAGYSTQTGRPPPAAPNEPVFPTPTALPPAPSAPDR